MGTKARILLSLQLDGRDYQPNQIVDFPPALAKALRTEGMIDTSKEAVAYCVDELGAEVLLHEEVAATVEAAAETPAVEADAAPATV